MACSSAASSPPTCPTRPWSRDALDRVGFVVSLEVRASEVTDRADVVLPVAPPVERGGTFVTWEGRPRPFPQALVSHALPDHRVLDRLADELGVVLGLGSLADVHAELDQIGGWDGARAAAPAVAADEPPAVAPGTAVLATWHQLLDNGRLQSGEQHLAGTAKRPVARISAGTTAAAAGVADGGALAVSTDAGTITLPVAVTRHARPRGLAADERAGIRGPGHPARRRGRRRPHRQRRHRKHGGGVMLTAAVASEGADFSNDTWWLWVIKAVVIIVFLLTSVLFAIWFERKVVARMQVRPGPNVHGPFGLLQSLADAMKLLFKEDMTVTAADKIVYVVAPMIAVFCSLLTFAVIPLGPSVNLFGHETPLQLTDFPVAVLYILACASVGVYGIVLGGWASNSTYPLLGSVRSTAQVISYELAMGLSLVSVFLLAGSMSTSQIVESQNRIWWVLPLLPAFVIYVISMVGETNRLPFDLPEAEGELVSGYMTEYSSMKFAWFFLAEYINMLNVSAVATTLFLGGWHAPFGISQINDGMFNTGWWAVIWFLIKLWAVMFFFVWVRGSVLRFRYDQFMNIGWKRLIPAALVWVVLVGAGAGAAHVLARRPERALRRRGGSRRVRRREPAHPREEEAGRATTGGPAGLRPVRGRVPGAPDARSGAAAVAARPARALRRRSSADERGARPPTTTTTEPEVHGG